MPDVLIVGAGPAGASLALMLGRAGLDVALFDKARFPRDKACGEGLMPSGVAVYQRLGLDDLLEAGTPFWGVKYHAGPHQATGRFPVLPGLPNYGLGQRRLVSDERLLSHARATPGVRLHEGARVERLLSRHGRVVGVEVEGTSIEAPLVVLASGLHSPLRRSLGLEGPAMKRSRLGLRAHFRLAIGKQAAPWVEVFLGSRRQELYVTPLPNGELLIAALADQGTVDDSPERTFHRWVSEETQLADRLEGAEQISPIIGMSPLATQPRAGVAPGLVLLGDAAGFIDPITGGGIAQALCSAELLAAWMPAILADSGDTALWRFDAARAAMLRDYRRLTRGVLMLADHPWLARGAIALLANLPALYGHLLGVSSGLLPLLPGLPTRLEPTARAAKAE